MKTSVPETSKPPIEAKTPQEATSGFDDVATTDIDPVERDGQPNEDLAGGRGCSLPGAKLTSMEAYSPQELNTPANEAYEEPQTPALSKKAETGGMNALSNTWSMRKNKPKDPYQFLPHAGDVERAFLSSYFNAPLGVGQLCVEIDVLPEHFYLPENRIIFEWLHRMWREKKPIDMITVTQAMQDAGQLQAVGGAPYVTEVSTFLPTAANASQYARILKEKYSQREVIRVCTEAVERSRTDQGDVPTLLSEVERNVLAVTKALSSSSIRDTVAERTFSAAKTPPEAVPVFKLESAIIATSGNLMAVQAKAKAGKSAALGGLMASTMNAAGDCLGFISDNTRGYALLHFDTEQSPRDHYEGLMRVLKRAGRREEPPWLRSCYLTDLPLQKRLQLVRHELARAQKDLGGVFAVIIDGIGDLCVDPNDPKEANSLVDEMHRLAVEFNTVFVCVLHENPGSDIGKTRGHLGSQLERKAETNLRLEKNGEGVSVLWTDRARSAFIPKERGARFKWSDEAGMHISTTAAFKTGNKTAGGAEKPRANARLKTAAATLGRVFANGVTLRRADFQRLSRIKTPTTFDNYWAALKEAGMIVHDQTVPRVFSASPEWAAELAQDFPPEDEGVNS